MKPVTNFRNSGFTLLEVLVALLVLTVVVMAVFRLQASTLSMAAYAQFDETAPFLAQRVLARIEAASEWDAPSGSGGFENAFAGYRYAYTINGIEEEPFDTTDGRLKRIDITITRESGPQEYRLQSHRLAPPE